MTRTVDQLFEAEARDLDPRWVALATAAATAAGVTNAESAPTAHWNDSTARAWDADASAWLAEVNSALNNPFNRANPLYIAIGQRFDVVARRSVLLEKKGLGRNDPDLVVPALRGFRQGVDDASDRLLNVVKVVAVMLALYWASNLVRD